MSTFAVVQGRIVKARFYLAHLPGNPQKVPLARLVFEVPAPDHSRNHYIPVVVQGDTVAEVQAFLEAGGAQSPEAFATGDIRRYGPKTEVFAQRISFLTTEEDRTRAVAALRQQPERSTTQQNPRRNQDHG
jgi:hypothetical protein